MKLKCKTQDANEKKPFGVLAFKGERRNRIQISPPQKQKKQKRRRRLTFPWCRAGPPPLRYRPNDLMQIPRPYFSSHRRWPSRKEKCVFERKKANIPTPLDRSERWRQKKKNDPKFLCKFLSVAVDGSRRDASEMFIDFQ